MKKDFLNGGEFNRGGRGSGNGEGGTRGGRMARFLERKKDIGFSSLFWSRPNYWISCC